MAREGLVQKAKEVREALLELAREYIDATHIEVGQIKAKDDAAKLLTIRVADANRYVPYQGHDTSEFTVGDYWAVMFDDLGTVRLGWWISNNVGAGTIPFRNHNLLDGDAHPDTVAQVVTRGSIIVGDDTPEWNELVKGAVGTVLTAGVLDISWVPLAGGAGLKAIFWHVDGPLVAGTEVGEARLLPQDMEFTKAYIYCKTTGTAGSTIADIHKNGVTIYTTQANRPTLLWNDPDKKAVTVAPDVTAGLEGDIMTIDIDQAATGAEDLVIVLLFAGVIGGLPFGSCYGNHIAWVQAAAAQNTWYNISDADIADGQLNAVTHDGSGKLTVTEPGQYLITYSLCYEDNIAKDHLEVGIEVSGSGVAEAAGRTHSENKFANEMEHLGGSAILDLEDNATLELAIRTIDAGAPNITVIAMNLAAVMVRGG